MWHTSTTCMSHAKMSVWRIEHMGRRSLCFQSFLWYAAEWCLHVAQCVCRTAATQRFISYTFSGAFSLVNLCVAGSSTRCNQATVAYFKTPRLCSLPFSFGGCMLQSYGFCISRGGGHVNGANAKIITWLIFVAENVKIHPAKLFLVQGKEDGQM